MSISAATSFEPRCEVTVKDARIVDSKSMIILGLVLDSYCSFKSHVEKLRSKLRAKTTKAEKDWSV